MIRDIRTGRALGRTTDLTDTFIEQIVVLRKLDRPCYVVTGNCRLQEQRLAVDIIREAGIIVVRDPQFPPDTFWLFEGRPEELGFAV